MVHCVMGILGLLLGAGISAGVLTVVTRLPLAWARGVAALAFTIAPLSRTTLSRHGPSWVIEGVNHPPC